MSLDKEEFEGIVIRSFGIVHDTLFKIQAELESLRKLYEETFASSQEQRAMASYTKWIKEHGRK